MSIELVMPYNHLILCHSLLLVTSILENKKVSSYKSISCSVDFWTSLVVQWLRLCASTAGGTGSVPAWGTKIPHAVQYGQEKKFYVLYYIFPFVNSKEVRIFKTRTSTKRGFPGGSVEDLPINAGDRGWIPGPGRSHMPQSN